MRRRDAARDRELEVATPAVSVAVAEGSRVMATSELEVRRAGLPADG